MSPGDNGSMEHLEAQGWDRTLSEKSKAAVAVVTDGDTEDNTGRCLLSNSFAQRIHPHFGKESGPALRM